MSVFELISIMLAFVALIFFGAVTWLVVYIVMAIIMGRRE